MATSGPIAYTTDHIDYTRRVNFAFKTKTKLHFNWPLSAFLFLSLSDCVQCYCFMVRVIFLLVILP